MKPSSPEVIALARSQMEKAVWGYLSAILPASYSDEQIDAATQAFILRGMQKIAFDLGAGQSDIQEIGRLIAESKP